MNKETLSLFALLRLLTSPARMRRRQGEDTEGRFVARDLIEIIEETENDEQKNTGGSLLNLLPLLTQVIEETRNVETRETVGL